MVLDEIDWKLMNTWQRAMPIVPRPFQEIAQRMGLDEAETLARIKGLLKQGAVSRVGATCRPNTLAASTLCAVAAPEGKLEEVAEVINGQDGVNHSYERENRLNIWFVATGPTRAFVNGQLREISEKTGLRVLDLRLVQPFNVDLGFALDGTSEMVAPAPVDDTVLLNDSDRDIMQCLSDGLSVESKPFAALAHTLGRTEKDVLDRIYAMGQAGVMSRLGLIVRHRPLGWRSNAMCVFNVPKHEVTERGLALTKVPGVTLCYERRPDPQEWPYSLYCMIHGRSRAEALDVLTHARVHAGLTQYEYKVLFSTRCFKQTGALINRRKEPV